MYISATADIAQTIEVLGMSIHIEQMTIDKFAAELAKDPFHAFEWAGNDAITSAARIKVLGEIRGLCEKARDAGAFSEALTKYALDRGRGGMGTSTDPIMNRARSVEAKEWIEFAHHWIYGKGR
jgi:hypothetical protein